MTDKIFWIALAAFGVWMLLGCEVEENRAHANRVMEKYVAVDSEPLSDREKFEKKMKILRERM